MALVIPTPRDVVGVARATTSWALDTVLFVAVLPVRVATVLTDVEQLVARISEVADDAALAITEVRRIVEASAGVVDGADRVVSGAERTVEGAARVIIGAEGTVEGAGRVIAGAESTVEGAAGVIAGAESTVHGAEVAIRSVEVTGTDAARIIAEAARATHAAMALLDTWRPIAEQAAPLAGRFVQEFSEEELQAAIRAVDQLPALTAHLQNDVMPLLATLDRTGPDVHELLDVAKDVREAIAGIPGFTFFRRRGEHKID